MEARLWQCNRLPREVVWLREIIATLVEVDLQLQSIPTLDIVLVHNRGRKSDDERPLVLAHTLFEWLGAD